MNNPGFTQDEETGVHTLSLKDLGLEKSPKEPVGSRDRLTTKGHATSFTTAPPGQEGEEEDYSLFSFLPHHAAYRQKYSALMQNEHVSAWLDAAAPLLVTVVYCVYFIAVMTTQSAVEDVDYWCDGDGLLMVLTGIAVTLMIYYMVILKYFGKRIYEGVLKPIQISFGKQWKKRCFRVTVYLALVSPVVAFLVVDTAGNPRRLIPLFGLSCLLLFGFVFSHAPRKIIWRHIFWGLGLQFLMGLFILRWSVGRSIFECIGGKVSRFLAFTDKGTSFVFGSAAEQGIFAFAVLPVVLFFSFCIQILYHYGIMQRVVIKLGWLLQVTVGTTTCESVNAAANIFLGQTEAPLIIKPYLALMTKSELHAVMTGGFATIAGTVMAAFISFGVSASHLLSASVMSAPAALAYAKLFYPETERSRMGADDIKVVRGSEVNALHAAIEGVVDAIRMVANMAANLISFVAFVAFCNAVFNWSCELVNVSEGVCTLENISGYVFTPLAWSMGVAWEECHDVGTLIGLKTFMNEFVAYASLSKMMQANTLSVRAQIISTYALCGFSNIASIGIQLGCIGAMAPERRADMAQIVVRAMIAGCAACFMTACIAGVLLDELHPDVGGTNDTLAAAIV